MTSFSMNLHLARFTFAISLALLTAASAVGSQPSLSRPQNQTPPAPTPTPAPAAPATPPAPAVIPTPTPAPAGTDVKAATSPVRLGFCDVVGASSRLMSTPAYTKAISDKQAELTMKIQPLEQQLTSLMEQLRKADPQPGVKPIDPDKANALRDQLSQRQQEYSTLSQKMSGEFAQFVASKNAEAYRQVMVALNTVADRRGYAVVFAVRPMEDMKGADSPPAFIQSVLARPAVRFPAEDDLTTDVVKELKLPDPAATPAAPANGDAPAPSRSPTTPAPKKP